MGTIEKSYMASEPDGLLDLVRVLWSRWWLIMTITAAGCAIAAGVAFLLPDMYTAGATLMPPQQPQTTASALIGQLGPLAAMAGGNLGLKSPSDLYVGLAGGRTIADHIIERFRLRDLYKAKTMVDARAKLRSMSRFSSGKDSLIKIEVDDPSPARAAEIANMYAVELNSQNTAFGTTEATQRRQFLEKQVAEERAQLALAEEGMKQVQTKTGIIQVEAQTSVAIASAAQLKAQITAGEVALKRLEMGAAPQNPEVLRIQTELDALRSQLRSLEVGARGAGDPLVATSAIPSGGLEYVRRLRELKYHEFLFEMLSKQYEAARIDENKAAPALQVVDFAVPPDKKSGPHRGLMMLFGSLASATAASLFVYYRHSMAASARSMGAPTAGVSVPETMNRNGVATTGART
jgi:uncharacterized protein involved in exopolysaccharide biosynthesis